MDLYDSMGAAACPRVDLEQLRGERKCLGRHPLSGQCTAEPVCLEPRGRRERGSGRSHEDRWMASMNQPLGQHIRRSRRLVRQPDGHVHGHNVESSELAGGLDDQRDRAPDETGEFHAVRQGSSHDPDPSTCARIDPHYPHRGRAGPDG